MSTALEVSHLHAWYGDSHILHGVNLSLAEGQLVALLGKNGAGKTTTLRSIINVGPRVSGSIRLMGRDIINKATERIARMGIAYCPEERAIFSSLTVEENLLLPPKLFEGGLELKEIYELFPNLAARSGSQGTKLSGGEQQMLAIARILRTGSKLILLDEPTEGLAPIIVQQIAKTIALLRNRGFTILLVEQNLRFAMSVADQIYLMEHGATVDVLDARAARNDMSKIQEWLSV